MFGAVGGPKRRHKWKSQICEFRAGLGLTGRFCCDAEAFLRKTNRSCREASINEINTIMASMSGTRYKYYSRDRDLRSVDV